MAVLPLSKAIVGMTRFELATPRPPDVCATGLRYIPNTIGLQIYNLKLHSKIQNKIYLRSLMKVLIKGTQIIDSSSTFHLQFVDVFISDGIITAIQPNLTIDADQVIDMPGLQVSPGWVDVFANFCDPGYEFKETLESGCAAAAAGGYTDVMIIPNTSPALHNKSSIEYIAQKSSRLPVSIHPIGAITKNTEGKELAEMYDMHQSGAIAFSDGTNPLQSSGVLLKALQYVKAIDAVIIQLPDDKNISANGLMNEGIVSTRLGLPGKPAIAEELMIARDIELAKYTGSKIHFTGVSTKKGIDTITAAKKEGVSVSCSVTPYHLFFCDEDLTDYDSNLKVNPPLRTASDREALQQAVLNGEVDCIATHHFPQDTDHKMVEFEYAKNGMIGLQTGFAILKTVLPQVSIEQFVKLLSTNPRKLFHLPTAAVAKGNAACLTLFSGDKSWQFNGSDIKSKSKNSPFVGMQLTGKPIGIINKDKVFLSQQ